jgi:hypothetical protein
MHDLIYREGLLEEMEDSDLPEIDPEEIFSGYTQKELKTKQGITGNMQDK